ncbi:uncharacterized protein, partial [Clytia hemisphaerica]|uniref:uncharacterized protein n=1 Tax=Clytia hemisphaerica TaxID=252671 RepID=UPI0034D62CF0
KYKFFCCGDDTGYGGVGILLEEALIKNVISVERINSRIMYIRIMIEKSIIRFFSVYAPQTGLPEPEKDKFYNDLLAQTAIIPAEGFLIICGDLNGHIQSGKSSQLHAYRRKETWWWNETVDRAVKEKCRLWKCWKRGGQKEPYLAAKGRAKSEVFIAKKNGLLNSEFDWDESVLSHAEPLIGPPLEITQEMVLSAIKKMKSGKSAGPSGIVPEMLKISYESVVPKLTSLIKYDHS